MENFLPERYAAWSKDLKKSQDLLGEVHDLDVLEATLDETTTPPSHAPLREAIAKERTKRLDTYTRKTEGDDPLWTKWRAGLPVRRALTEASVAKLAAWATFQDVDMATADALAERAVRLYEAIRKGGQAPSYSATSCRRLLRVAALLAGVAHGPKGARRIESLAPPVGWTRRHLEMVALIVRYRDSQPRSGHKVWASLTPAQREVVAFMAGVLKIAAADTGA